MSPESGANPSTDPAGIPPTVPYRKAFLFWLKLGFVSFGGPAGQIAIMHRELVERKGWISEKRFLHALNYCMVIPGPEAQQLATYIGWLMHRTAGGITAGALFVLPSLLILIALSWVYTALGNLPLIQGLFYGIKPAVTALVLQALVRIASRTLKHALLWVFSLLAFIAVFVLGVPFPLVVLSAAVLGILGGKFFPMAFRSRGHGAAGKSFGPALIDDETPTPPHALVRWPRIARTALAGLLLWGLPFLLLVAIFGWNATLPQMAWFFSQTALVTFGGAYAVLPYVFQGAVNHYGWLSATQMIDGLALGETTPGPLIMVLAFVGFLGGWNGAIFGQNLLPLAGAIAAIVVTWFTFLPSFLFILIGGPFIESTKNDTRFTAPLTAITAAVVGVIASLAVFFAYHVFWPKGLYGIFDWPSLAIALSAAAALIFLKRNAVEVIIVCAALGLAIKLISGAAS